MPYQDTYKNILNHQQTLATKITKQTFESHPELLEKYGSAGKEKCIEDSLLHIKTLAESINLESKNLFASYLHWVQIMLQSRNIPLADLKNNLRYTGLACKEILDAKDL